MPTEPLLVRARRALTGTVLEPLAGRAIDGAIDGAINALMREGLARLIESVRALGGQPLDVELPDGSRLSFGDAPCALLRIKDPAALALMRHADLDTLGSAFVEGRIDIEGDMLAAARAAAALAQAQGRGTNARGAAPDDAHPSVQDAADIAFHYDVGNAFYRLWLDAQWVYSCAYFENADATLDEAQRAKLDYICRKLRLTEGERFLDVGCGWGALVLHAARHYGVQATGITLSRQQLERAQQRVAEEGLAGRVEVLLLDYRDLPARFGPASFDKVSSVGMFEHVGLRQLPVYFAVMAHVLRDRGLFLNHGITSSDIDNRPVGGGASEFIERFVFPHGELPHLTLAVGEMSRAGFEIADVESLRPHYALTLAHWSQRLNAVLDEARRVVPEKTLRVWQAYLAGCAVGFEQGWMNVYQLLGSRQIDAGATALPLTRASLYP